jgi:hypothetical protein
MSHLSVKIAVCAAVLSLVPLGYEWTANASLRAEFQESQKQQPGPGAALPVTATLPAASASSDLASIRAELARVDTATKAAQARAAELSNFKDRLKDEHIVSLGSVEAMAKELGSTLRRMNDLRDATADSTAYPPRSPEWKKREAAMQEIEAGVPKLFSVLRELPQLERDPVKAARFYATLVGESAELDEQTRARLEPHLQAWVSRLQHDALALPQRPLEPDEAKTDWDKRRIAAMQEISTELQMLVPAAKAERVSLFRALMLEPKPDHAREAFDMIIGPKQ